MSEALELGVMYNVRCTMYRSVPGVRGRIYVVHAFVPVGKTCVNKFMQQGTWFWVGVIQGS